MLITRRSATGIEQLPWLRAVLALASEARLPLDEASAALRSGERRTHLSLFTSENDTMSDDDLDPDFEYDDFEYDDDYDPELDDDFLDAA